ncbi:unnamed protein product [Arctogadus glacialis]
MSWSRLLVQWGNETKCYPFCCQSATNGRLQLMLSFHVSMPTVTQKPQQRPHTQKKKKRNWCIQSSMYLYKWCNGNKMYEINNLESFCWVCHSHARMHTHMQTHTLHMQTYTHKHTHTHKHLSSTHTHTHTHTHTNTHLISTHTHGDAHTHTHILTNT